LTRVLGRHVALIMARHWLKSEAIVSSASHGWISRLLWHRPDLHNAISAATARLASPSSLASVRAVPLRRSNRVGMPYFVHPPGYATWPFPLRRLFCRPRLRLQFWPRGCWSFAASASSNLRSAATRAVFAVCAFFSASTTRSVCASLTMPSSSTARQPFPPPPVCLLAGYPGSAHVARQDRSDRCCLAMNVSTRRHTHRLGYEFVGRLSSPDSPSPFRIPWDAM